MHAYNLCITKSQTEISEKKMKYYNKVLHYFIVIFQMDFDVVVPASSSSSSTLTKHLFPAATYRPHARQKVQTLKKNKSEDQNLWHSLEFQKFALNSHIST